MAYFLPNGQPVPDPSVFMSDGQLVTAVGDSYMPVTQGQMTYEGANPYGSGDPRNQGVLHTGQFANLIPLPAQSTWDQYGIAPLDMSQVVRDSQGNLFTAPTNIPQAKGSFMSDVMPGLMAFGGLGAGIATQMGLFGGGASGTGATGAFDMGGMGPDLASQFGVGSGATGGVPSLADAADNLYNPVNPGSPVSPATLPQQTSGGLPSLPNLPNGIPGLPSGGGNQSGGNGDTGGFDWTSFLGNSLGAGLTGLLNRQTAQEMIGIGAPFRTAAQNMVTNPDSWYSGPLGQSTTRAVMQGRSAMAPGGTQDIMNAAGALGAYNQHLGTLGALGGLGLNQGAQFQANFNQLPGQIAGAAGAASGPSQNDWFSLARGMLGGNRGGITGGQQSFDGTSTDDWIRYASGLT